MTTHPWRDGSVAVEYDPVDFIGKLAALVPRPRANLVRYHGCLAPHASIRAHVVNDGRERPSATESVTIGKAASLPSVASHAARSCAPEHPRFRWAELMRRVFEIDVLACPSCGGRMKPIAEITDRALARRMLAHVGLPGDPAELWPARGPLELLGSSGLDDDQGWPDDASEPTTPDAD